MITKFVEQPRDKNNDSNKGRVKIVKSTVNGSKSISPISEFRQPSSITSTI